MVSCHDVPGTCENTLPEGRITCLSAAWTCEWFIALTHICSTGCQILLLLKATVNPLLTFVVPEEVPLEFGLPWYFMA